MYEKIDYEKLGIMDYFGTTKIYNLVAVIEFDKVENAFNLILERIIIQNGFNCPIAMF